MKNTVILIGLTLLLSSCTKNKAPRCLISSPLNGAEIEKGITVIISADVDDEDGNLSEVRFYIDDSEVNTSSTSAYSYNWNTSDASTGIHTIKAMAIDDEGAKAFDNINITLTDTGSKTETVTDIDGNVYNTVTIGRQTWMAENLKVTRYPDGTNIPLVTDNTAWGNLGDNGTDDAYCYFNNNESGEANAYGALYTWAAAMGDNAVSSSSNPSGVQGICPNGWHLPSDAEWTELTDLLGGRTIAGGKMKEIGTTHWKSPNSGADNSSGFTALPGRRRTNNGSFDILGFTGDWWSATENGTNAWYRELYYDYTIVNRFSFSKSYGFSVRCVKDY